MPPGFDVVPSCDFYAYLHYEGQEAFPRDLHGTGGGRSPHAVSGVNFDLTLPSGYHLTRPRATAPEPAEPDVRYTINLGLLGPTCAAESGTRSMRRVRASHTSTSGAVAAARYAAAIDHPLTKGRWYMDESAHNSSADPPRSWQLPTTPLYHTQVRASQQCGETEPPFVEIS